MKLSARILCFGLAIAFHGSAEAVTMNWATVGNPGNANDTADGDHTTVGVQNFGMVTTTYRIAKEEVSNAQYVEFLNVVDPTGANPNGIYNSFMGSDVRGGISLVSRKCCWWKICGEGNHGKQTGELRELV